MGDTPPSLFWEASEAKNCPKRAQQSWLVPWGIAGFAKPINIPYMDAMGYVPVFYSLAPKLGRILVPSRKRRNIKPKAPLALQCFRPPFGDVNSSGTGGSEKKCVFFQRDL